MLSKKFVKQTLKVFFVMIFFNVVLIGVSFAFQSDNFNSNSFAYDVYDIAVNNILKGPIGFVCACACIVLGATMAVKNQLMLAVPAFIAGAILFKADVIVKSLGLIC